MKDYPINDIINLAVTGHASTGKTMLCESILLNANKIRKMGSGLFTFNFYFNDLVEEVP